MATALQIVLVLLLIGAAYPLLRKPTLRVERGGLRVPGTGTGLVPWDAIEGVWQPSGSDTEAVHLRLRDDALPCRSGRRVMRIDLRDSGLTAAELVSEILRRAAVTAPLSKPAPDSASRLSS